MLSLTSLAAALLASSSACGPAFAAPAPTQQALGEILVLAPADPSTAGSERLEEAREAIEGRLQAELEGGAVVAIEGGRIVVALGGSAEAGAAVEMLVHPHGNAVLIGDVFLERGAPAPPGVPLIEGGNVIASRAELSASGEWQVRVHLTSVGGRILDTYAGANAGRVLTLAQDGVVVRSMLLEAPDRSNSSLFVADTVASIAGNLTEASARALATALNTGELPLRLVLVEPGHARPAQPGTGGA